ncbi:MAG: saccharopine reductase [Saprospiraceae bacterium]|nr:MAG: saccharopine reductase [Saprospiraceae bacterium]
MARLARDLQPEPGLFQFSQTSFSMKKIIVLGAGLVGSAIALDLAQRHDVTSADRSEEALSRLIRKGKVKTVRADLSKPDVIRELVADYDLVIGALPGFMGFEALRAVLEAGKNVVDISFFPEDPFELDELARERGVTAVVDCGVAPGLGNILLGFYAARHVLYRFRCLVGGLPVVRHWPWQYRAVFSPADVIEEYLRPARFRQNGELVVKPALSDLELVEFDRVGTLEAFNTDGLRTLLRTMSTIPDMVEKTLRYPGTVEYLRVLKDSGFFSSEPLLVNGVPIRPVDYTSQVLFPQWKLKPGEADFTIMRIEIDSAFTRWQFDLLDYYDPKTDTISMARTTGYTCSAVANLLLEGKFTDPGINAPEHVGFYEECKEYVLEYLRQRNVPIHLTEFHRNSMGDEFTC